MTPEKESDTTIFAPLLDLTMDQTFLLELRYTVPGGPAQLDLPAFPEDPAVQKVMLCAYVPETSVLLSRSGPWSNEREEIVFSGVGINGRVDDDGLINWVTEDPEGGRNPAVAEGLANGAKSVRTFPIGKSQLYVYSTLRPQDAPAGSLHLATMNRRLFQAIVIVVMALVGLPLYGRSLRLQLSLLLAAAILLLLIGVFVPELAKTVLGSVFPVAVLVLLLVWFIGHVNKLRKWRIRATPAPAEPRPRARLPLAAQVRAARERQATRPPRRPAQRRRVILRRRQTPPPLRRRLTATTLKREEEATMRSFFRNGTWGPDGGSAARSRRRGSMGRAAWWAVVAAASCLAASPARTAEPAKEPQTQRTLFVPFDDLPVLLGGDNQRVFMTREEFRQLESEARKRPATAAPVAALLLAARYNATIREGAVTILGELEVESLDPGVHAIPLALAGVAVRSATLDDQPAPLGRDANGNVVLFVKSVGHQLLKLELHAPVTIAAAQQSLQCELPRAGGTALNLVVPGNVEVKSGATVAQRTYDEQNDRTSFQLTPDRGAMTLVMSLNNRRLRQDRVLVARSVVVSELTTTYERLHATVHFDVLHGAVDRLLLDVPPGFQITAVSSPLMSQWVIREIEQREVLEVTLREATRTTEVLNIAGTRTPVAIEAWTMPRLTPREVAGHAAVLGLLAESRLRPLGVDGQGLIPIDTSVLREALPDSMFEAAPGAPEIRPIVAFYAPGETYQLTASLEDPRDELRAATHLLLTLDEARQTLRGGFTLTPQAKKRTAFSFRMPEHWQLDKLEGADQTPLPFRRYKADGALRCVVTLPKAIEPGQSQTVYFQASHTSSAWLGEWSSTEVAFPRVQVEQTTASTGAIAVQATGDLVVTKPIVPDTLTPLDASQRGQFGLGDASTELTYRFAADDFEARFVVERIVPRISSRNYAFFQVRDGLLRAHYEIVFVIDRAHAHKLELELPDSTPTAVLIRGLDDVRLKEYSHATRDGKHVWTVVLAQSHLGSVRLAVDFEQRLDTAALKDEPLPLIRVAGVAYQTQMVAVEGDPVLDVNLKTTMRRVDIGELVEAEYPPGPHLLGAFASTTDGDTLAIDVARRDLRPLPAAIVKRAQLVTLVSTSGVSQTAARYLLRTKVPFLAIRFAADEEIWSVTLNGKPVKPRRRGKEVLLSLQTDQAGDERDLQVVYQAPVSPIRWIGRIASEAPQLWLVVDEQDQGVPVPQVDLEWHVYLPAGYRVSRVHGTVFSEQVARPRSPIIALARAGVATGGGIHRPLIAAPMMLAAHAESRATQSARGMQRSMDTMCRRHRRRLRRGWGIWTSAGVPATRHTIPLDHLRTGQWRVPTSARCP